jgi:hypothetical protein
MSKEVAKELKKILRLVSKGKVHYSEMNSFNRQRCEGWNDALNVTIKLLNRQINKYNPPTKPKRK